MARIRSSSAGAARPGKVAVIVALSLTTLLGMSAFALDGGTLMAERRHAQATADAAALAGAITLFKAYPTAKGVDSGTAKASALAVAASNGYANDGLNSQVTVNIPPTSGRFVGKPGYIEVIAQYNQPRGFSAIWSSSRIPVRARAVARGLWIPPAFGILTLSPTASPATNANGNGLVTVNGGGVITDSSDSGGLRVTGGGSMVATNFDVAGSSYTGSNFSTSPTVNVPPTPDPLRSLPYPPLPAAGTLTKTTVSGTNYYTVTPGLFGKGVLPNFGGGNNPDVVTFKPGIYYLQEGLTSTGATITGNGVMFFNAPSSNAASQGISISGGTVTLTPMTTGTWAGITFFQRRDATQAISISGGGTFNIDGTFYAAGAEMKITGSSGTAKIGSQYISNTLTLGGNGNIVINAASTNKANQRLIDLVE